MAADDSTDQPSLFDDVVPTHKRCSSCHVSKPVESFCRNARQKDGRHYSCRECTAGYKKATPQRRAQNPSVTPAEKQCRKCGGIKPIAEFRRRIHMADSHANECKPCEKAMNAAIRARVAAEGRDKLPTAGRVRQCRRCGQTKPIVMFKANPHSTGGREQRCRKCQNESTFHQRRSRGLKNTFGMTAEDYAQMVAVQGGTCAICRRPETAVRNGRVKALAVDHDHATGKVRGLLCLRCNKAIGLLREEIPLFYSAIAYLERYKQD